MSRGIGDASKFLIICTTFLLFLEFKEISVDTCGNLKIIYLPSFVTPFEIENWEQGLFHQITLKTERVPHNFDQFLLVIKSFVLF